MTLNSHTSENINLKILSLQQQRKLTTTTRLHNNKVKLKLKILLVGSELYTIPAFNPTYDDSLIHPQQTVTFFVLSSMGPPPGSVYQYSLFPNRQTPTYDNISGRPPICTFLVIEPRKKLLIYEFYLQLLPASQSRSSLKDW